MQSEYSKPLDNDWDGKPLCFFWSHFLSSWKICCHMPQTDLLFMWLTFKSVACCLMPQQMNNSLNKHFWKRPFSLNYHRKVHHMLLKINNQKCSHVVIKKLSLIYLCIYIYIQIASTSSSSHADSMDFFTTFCHPFLSFCQKWFLAISSRSSRLHPVSAQSWWMKVLAIQPILVHLYIGVHKRMLHMNLSSLPQHFLFIFLLGAELCDWSTNFRGLPLKNGDGFLLSKYMNSVSFAFMLRPRPPVSFFKLCSRDSAGASVFTGNSRLSV